MQLVVWQEGDIRDLKYIEVLHLTNAYVIFFQLALGGCSAATLPGRLCLSAITGLGKTSNKCSPAGLTHVAQ